MRKGLWVVCIIGIIFILGGLVRDVIEVATIVLGTLLILFAITYNKIEKVHKEVQDLRKEVRELTSSRQEPLRGTDEMK